MGVWAGGARAPPPPNFCGRAKINATFGQNIKISEKYDMQFFMSGKVFLCLLASFWVCPENFFGMSRKNYLVCSEKFFLVCPDKIFW
jgi:hypothetical protein